MSTDLIAWGAEVNGLSAIVFASTRPKARWRAVKSYWEAYDRRKGEWPSIKVWRRPEFDRSELRLRDDQRAWSESYVLDVP